MARRLKKVADSAGPLYNSLDDAQKHRFMVLARVLRRHEGTGDFGARRGGGPGEGGWHRPFGRDGGPRGQDPLGQQDVAASGSRRNSPRAACVFAAWPVACIACPVAGAQQRGVATKLDSPDRFANRAALSLSRRDRHSEFGSGRIAQLVEQLTLNQRVQGSSPCAPTNQINNSASRPLILFRTK